MILPGISKFKLIIKFNLFRGIYHYFRRTILNFKNSNFVMPSEIRGNFLIKNKDRQLFLDYFSENELQKNKLLNIADQFCQDKVNIYGKEVNLDGFTIEKFQKNINEGDVFKDLRFSWEVYRCKFVFLVGLSYWITGDERYCKSLTRFIRRWKDFSPLASYSSPYNGMEAALKVINLSWCDFFLKQSKGYGVDDQKILIELLIQHTDYIYKNYDISIYGLESNHSLSCTIGLLYASCLFPDYEMSNRWKRFGMRTLKRALKKQYSIDGVNFESSVHYHRYTFELLIFLLGIFYRNNFHSEQSIEESIRRIGMALNFLTHKNGYISRFGDNDGGKFLYDLGTVQEFNSLNYLKYFSEGKTTHDIESLLFSSVPELKGFLKEEQKRSRIGGYVGYKGHDLSLIISANEIGTNGKGNHQHNDFLAFELYTKNVPFIIDRWSYCYHGDKKTRNQDRLTFYHNNIQIDRREIVPFDERRLFEMLGDIKVGINSVSENSDRWTADAWHDGYKDLETGRQIHRRIFEIFKNENLIKIKDILIGNGCHSATMNLLIPQKDWSYHQDEEGLYFKNDYETFSINSNMGVFEVTAESVNENFLNPVPAYLCTVVTEYQDNLNTELTIKYEKRSHA